MMNRLLAVLLGLIALATLALGVMAWDRLYNGPTPVGLMATPAERAPGTPAKATHLAAERSAPEVAESSEPNAPAGNESASPVTEAPAVTKAPAVTEAPTVTKAPAVTEAPTVTKAPAVTEAPTVTQAPPPPTAPRGPDPALGAARRYAAGLEREVVRLAIEGLADRVSRDAKLIFEHSVEAARRASVGDASFSTSPSQVCTTTLPSETTGLDLIRCHLAPTTAAWPEAGPLRQRASAIVQTFLTRHRQSLSQALGFVPSANALGSRAMSDAAAARDTLVGLMRALARTTD